MMVPTVCEYGKGEDGSKGSGQRHCFRVAVTTGEGKVVREERGGGVNHIGTRPLLNDDWSMDELRGSTI
jgi:hypothetical protein